MEYIFKDTLTEREDFKSRGEKKVPRRNNSNWVFSLIFQSICRNILEHTEEMCRNIKLWHSWLQNKKRSKKLLKGVKCLITISFHPMKRIFFHKKLFSRWKELQNIKVIGITAMIHWNIATKNKWCLPLSYGLAIMVPKKVFQFFNFTCKDDDEIWLAN